MGEESRCKRGGGEENEGRGGKGMGKGKTERWPNFLNRRMITF